MATDAAILTAARNHAAAIAALKAAESEIVRLGDEQRRAGLLVDEKRKHAKECERHLLQLASQKPAEPPPVVFALTKESEAAIANFTKTPVVAPDVGGANFAPPDEKPVEVAKVLTHGVTPTQNLRRR